MSNRASLNHIYRSIWNPSLGVMVAVAEIASACCGATSSAQAQSQPSALPTGGVAVHGSALFNTGQPNKLVVTTQNGSGTNHSALNWNSFSIGAGNATQFVQPSVSSTSINRVVTNTPSVLFGTLSSNGKLVLVNQSGIAVGAGAVVDTAGFTASAVGMSEADAIAGRLRFGASGLTETGGALKVQGNLIARGGDVVLIAPTIDLAKTAVVEAQGGSVMLAAGQGVEVTGRGLEGITLQVQAPSDRAVNLGTLKGDAVGIFAGTLKHSGSIQATTVATEGGRVVLKAKDLLDIDGQVSAHSAAGKGGLIHATADTVVLRKTAVLDASGATGGGEIRVGGGWHGDDARISNAHQNVVLEGAQIKADATDRGDGGNVVVWADGATRFLGSISARGGLNGGDGGHAEVSGKQYLDFRGVADLSAPVGRRGSLLLDPANITIGLVADVNGDTSLGDDVTAAGLIFGDFSSSNSLITAAQVSSLLNASNLVLEANNNILVSAPITKSAPGQTTLTLHASNNLTVISPISTSGGDLNITLLAAGTIGLNAGLNAGTGDVALTGNGGITQSAGTINAKNLSASSASGSVILAGSNVITNGVTLAAGNALTFNNASLASSTIHGATAGNAVNITTAGPLTLDGSVYSSGGSVSIQVAGALTLTDHIGAVTTLNLDTSPVNGLIQQSAGDISVGGLATINAGTNDINLFSSSNNFGSVSLTGANVSVVSSAGLNVSALTYGANSNVYLDAGSGSLSLPAMNILTTGQLSLFSGTSFATSGNLAGSSVILQAPDGVSIGHNISATTLFLTADGISTSTGINQTAGSISVSGATVANAGTNNISLTSSTNDFSSFYATGLFTSVTDANSIALGDINTLTLDVIANGAVTQVPGTSIASSLTMDSGTGSITLDNSGNAIDFIRVLNAGAVSVTNTSSNTINLDSINASSFSLVAGGDIGSCCSTISTSVGGVSLKTTSGSIDLNTDSPTTVNSASGILIEATGDIGLRGVDLTANAGGNIVIKSSTGVLGADDLFGNIATITLNGGGRWLTYLNSPFSAHFYGPFVPTSASDFRQFDAPIGTAPLQGTGNGNLFTHVPEIYADLAGTVSKVFDGTTPISLIGASITNASGYLFNDSGGNVSGTGDLSNPNVGTVIPVSAVSQPLLGVVDSVLGFPSYGYRVNATGNIGEVTAAVLSTISLNGSRPYDGTNVVNAGIFTGLIGLVGLDDLTVSGAGTVANKNVGVNKPVTLGTLALGNGTIGLASNYTLSGGTHRATITPAPLPGLSLAVSNKVYDGTTAASLSGAVPTVFGSDSVTVASASAVFADKNVGTSKPVTVSSVGLTGADAANYDTTSQTFAGLADITARSISGISGVTASNKVYDRTVAASFSSASATLVGVLGGDTVALSGGIANFGDKNVGVGKAVTVTSLGLTGADAGNYTLGVASASALATISPATITPSAIANNKVYDKTTAATYSVTPSGLIPGDTVSVIGGAATFSDKNAALGKTVTIPGLSLNGTDAFNYTLSASSATALADISKATITSVTGITASNKTYDGNTAATLSTSSAVMAGVLPGDAATLTGATGAFSNKNVGTSKTVAVTGLNLIGADAGNYFLGSTTATALADITPASITAVSGVTANNKVYDTTTTATYSSTSATLTGKVAGDSLFVAGGTATFSDKNAGSGKTVTVPGLILTGADANNYTLGVASTTALADITKATITGVTGITASNKVYDGNTSAALSTSSAVIIGVLPGDSATLTGATGAFADKNVGSAKTVSVTGLNLAGPDAGNYFLGTTTATTMADITPATISGVSGITANSKTYDTKTSAVLNLSAAVLAGAVPGDAVGVAGDGQFVDKNAGLAKIVNVTGVVLSGADASNYIYSGPSTISAVAEIAKATISSLTGVTAVNKDYDGTTAATLLTTNAQFTGVLPGDKVTLAGAKGVFSDKNAGAAKSVTVSDGTLGGSDAGNYVLASNAVDAKATIFQRPLSKWTGSDGGSWSASSNWDVVPDGANVLAVSVPDGTGSITFDSGTTSLQSLVSSRPIVISGGSLSVGSDLNLPGLTQTAGNLTGTGGLNVRNSFNQTGGTIAMAGTVVANQGTGNLVAGSISAPSIVLNAQEGAISQTGGLVTAALQTTSTGGTNLGDAANRIGSFRAGNTGSGNITLVNGVPIVILSAVNTAGDLSVINRGGITFDDKAVMVINRNLTVVANSPLTIGAGGLTAGGDISLSATNLTSAGNITLNGPIKSGGLVSLVAANNMVQNSAVFGAKGVSASAGGSVAFGAQATSGNAPVSYVSSGVRVAVPGGGSSDSLASNDAVVTLLTLYERALDLQREEIFITQPDGTTRRKTNADAVVGEEVVCRP